MKAAERVRAARLRVFKTEFARLTDLPLSAYLPNEEAQRWESLPVDEIIETLRKQLVELLAAAENEEQSDDA